MKWLLVMLSKLLMWPYSLVVFPVAFAFKRSVRSGMNRGGLIRAISFVFWITLNDENDYGEEWYLDQKNRKENFATAWVWSWARNNSFNWNYYVVRWPHTKEVVTKSWTTDGRDPLLHRRIKWEYKKNINATPMWEWYGDWATNQGERLSQERTWIGKAWCRYEAYLLEPYKDYYGRTIGSKINKTRRVKQWRFSSVYIPKRYGIMVNIKAGWNDRGEALLDIKLKRFKPEYTLHWT